MARRPSVARRTTLYRLSTASDLHACLAPKYEGKAGLQIQDVEIAGVQALLVTGAVGREGGAEWCPIVRRLTGVDIFLQSSIASGGLLLTVDGNTFALTYGMGRVYIDPLHIEPGFGLRFALRALNPNRVRDVTRNILDERARVDRNSVPSGQEIGQYFIEEYGEIVSRLVGESAHVDLAFTRAGTARFTMRASEALSIPLAKDPELLLSDLREVIRVTDLDAPVPELEFVEQLREVKKSESYYPSLEGRLAEAFDDNSGIPLSLAYPRDTDPDTIEAQSYRLRLRGAERDPLDELSLDSIRIPVAQVSLAERVAALKSGTVQAFLDEEGTDPCSGQNSCSKWIACDVSLGERQFFFHAGSWFEVGQGYTEFLSARVDALLSAPAPLSLPDWPSTLKSEGEYSKYVAEIDPEYTCLDTRRISSPLHSRGIEPCDLVGPSGELIHVKPASKSAPLSHLFNQGLVSAELLYYDAEARKKFAAKVSEHGNGRVLDEAWRPRKVVFALASANDRTTPESMFTFAKVALVRCLQRLNETLRIDVSVIPVKRVE